MNTIKIKLFLIFSIIMVCYVLCGMLLNVLFLEDYYIYKNKGIFTEISRGIGEEYANNSGNIPEYIEMVDRSEGINCTVTDKNMQVRYNSFTQKNGREAKKLPKAILRLIVENKLKLADTYVCAVVEKQNDQAPKLVFISRMQTGELIILKKSMKGIRESADIANQFFVLAGILLILIGGIFIFIFSRRLTSPVIEMSEVAEQISRLEFDKRVEVHSRDEIGNLGTSINNISEKLSASINALKQDVERRKQLVRSISHELKTPIGVIKGYAEGLKYGVAGDKGQADKYCSVISEECDRMDHMVQELLNLSRLESGMFELNITRFDVAFLLQKGTARFEQQLQSEGITLELNCPEHLDISADYELIERVINNYITNAIKFAEEARLIKIAAGARGHMVRIEVFNTGEHIPQKDMENIWDVFYKADQARSRRYGGHGLGLSIVKLIADLHAGTAGAENVPDGVVFFVEIPIVRETSWLADARL